MRRLWILALLFALIDPAIAGAEGRKRSRPAPARKMKGRKAKARPSQVTNRPSSLAAARPRVGNEAPRGTTPLERELQEALDLALGSKWLKQSVNGVYVFDMVSGRILYSWGADRQLNPASNVKLVSTAAALDVLGGDFTWETKVFGPKADAAGAIKGDLFFVGTGDPTLRMTDLAELATKIHAAGVTKVEGDIAVGASDQRDGMARAGLRVTVIGGGREGAAPTVSVSPDAPLFIVETKAKTSSKGRRARLDVKVSQRGDKVVVTVIGKIRPSQRVTAFRTVPQAAIFAGHTLRSFLLQSGVEVTGTVKRVPEMPAGLGELAMHRSQPLGVVAGMVNKPSDNWLADRVIWTAGARELGGDPNNAKGLKTMESFLHKIGIDKGTYRLDNGSGLSSTNHMSARQIVQILLAGARDVRIAGDYLASLSIAGRDGTLRGRFVGRPSAGWMRGKTGTLTGVAALSGFVSAGGDDTLCFAILTNGHKKRDKMSVRAGHAAMVDAMYRYLAQVHAQKTGTIAPLPAPPVATTQPGDGEGIDGAEADDLPVIRF